MPPYVLEAIAENADRESAYRARQTLQLMERLRGRAEVLPRVLTKQARPPGGKRRTVYDATGLPFPLLVSFTIPPIGPVGPIASSSLSPPAPTKPAMKVRGEGDPAARDAAANQVYDAAGATHDLFFQVYKRDSLDGRGHPLDLYIHSGTGFNNAFWDGQQMAFGDSDTLVFDSLTEDPDVTGHELTHGVTEHSAGLEYHDQPGALNESMSDVFGSLVKQRLKGQTAGQADWLVGEHVFRRNILADGRIFRGAYVKGLRSMKEPGNAYNHPILGKDPQPAHMRDYDGTTSDNGGVHINSGIPNHAFYRAAVSLGGYAWEKAGWIWFDALTGGQAKPTASFADFANETVRAAAKRFGKTEEQAVREAWVAVGVL